MQETKTDYVELKRTISLDVKNEFTVTETIDGVFVVAGKAAGNALDALKLVQANLGLTEMKAIRKPRKNKKQQVEG